MMERTYQDNEIVLAQKAARIRSHWSTGKILYLLRPHEHKLGEAYVVEFLDKLHRHVDAKHIKSFRNQHLETIQEE